MFLTKEHVRMEEARARHAHWNRWGPFLSERAGAPCAKTTARTAPPGSIFRTNTRARAPIAGARTDSPASATAISASVSRWPCGTAATPSSKSVSSDSSGKQGNHGEDVKEQYFYLDNTPTHSYMKCLYKYPQAAFPYARLIEENSPAHARRPEYELLDTGVFADNRYFDVFVEYAKASPEDILIRVKRSTAVRNRPAPRAAHHLVPQPVVLGIHRETAGTAPRSGRHA